MGGGRGTKWEGEEQRGRENRFGEKGQRRRDRDRVG